MSSQNDTDLTGATILPFTPLQSSRLELATLKAKSAVTQHSLLMLEHDAKVRESLAAYNTASVELDALTRELIAEKMEGVEAELLGVDFQGVFVRFAEAPLPPDEDPPSAEATT